MADSSKIPNLKTLLGTGRRSGMRDRARGAFGASHRENEATRDKAVRETDQDAAGSRVSCTELGYLDDPYAKLFATQPSTRRLPLLNRGTYVRTSAIDQLVDRFITSFETYTKQIVSLGAGTDTRYFRLRDKHPDQHITYHEIDFPTNTNAKIRSIHRESVLQDRMGDSHFWIPLDSTRYCSMGYNIHGLDLRSLASLAPETPPPELSNFESFRPTLIISEMCLAYLEPSTVASILDVFLTRYLDPKTPAAIILYEPIRPNDAFGRTMISNLSTRHIRLPTLTAYPELGDQRARLKQYGFVDGHKAADTSFIWREWVSEEEKERVAGLEMLDELEELELLLKHYCVAWGWRNGRADGTAAWQDQWTTESGEPVLEKAWGDVKEQDEG